MMASNNYMFRRITIVSYMLLNIVVFIDCCHTPFYIVIHTQRECRTLRLTFYIFTTYIMTIIVAFLLLLEWSVVGCSVVKWSEGLSNRVPIIIRIYIHTKYEIFCLYGCLVYHILFVFFWFYFVSLYICLYVLYASA